MAHMTRNWLECFPERDRLHGTTEVTLTVQTPYYMSAMIVLTDREMRKEHRLSLTPADTCQLIRDLMRDMRVLDETSRHDLLVDLIGNLDEQRRMELLSLAFGRAGSQREIRTAG